MNEPANSLDGVSAWKAQQEANRAARLKQLYSPDELWRKQQAALAALAKLRPGSLSPRPKRKTQSTQAS